MREEKKKKPFNLLCVWDLYIYHFLSLYFYSSVELINQAISCDITKHHYLSLDFMLFFFKEMKRAKPTELNLECHFKFIV